MSQTLTVMLLDGGTVTRARDDAVVVRALTRSPNNRTVVIDQATDADDARVGALRFETIASQLKSVSQVTQLSFPILSMMRGREDILVDVTITQNSQMALIEVTPITRIDGIVDLSSYSTTSETILAVARRLLYRCVDGDTWRNYASIMSVEFTDLNEQYLSNAVTRITSIARGSFTVDSLSIQSRRESFEKILDIRTRLQHTSSALRSYDKFDDAIYGELHATISSCDALTTSLAGTASLIMQEQVNARAEAQMRADTVSLAQDRLIARAAAALIMPGIWFAFLGANVVPTHIFGVSVQSTEMVLISAVIGVVVGIAAWFTIRWLFAQKDENKRGTT